MTAIRATANWDPAIDSMWIIFENEALPINAHVSFPGRYGVDWVYVIAEHERKALEIARAYDRDPILTVCDEPALALAEVTDAAP